MPDSRFKLSPLVVRRAAIGLAGSAALGGLVVILGWHFNLARLIQILPDSAPMQYNTALALLLCGSGSVAAALNWRRVGLALATLAALIGLLTLSQYLFGVNLGLDQLFVKSTLMYKTSHPGRMAPLAAFCFILTGVALGLCCLSEKPGSLLAASSLSAVVLAFASCVLIVYVFELREPVFQSQYTRMAVHTAASFLLLAAGVYLLGWGAVDRAAGWLRQVIVPLTVCLLTATIYLWAALRAQEQSKITRESGLLAGVVKNGMETRLRFAWLALLRMARRWEIDAGTPRAAWEDDAVHYLNDLEGVQAVAWADASQKVQWSVSLKSGAAIQSHDLGAPRWRETLERAREQKTMAVSRPIELAQDGKGFFICVPVFRQGRFDGQLLLVYRLQGFFASVVNRHRQRGDLFAILDEREEVSRLGETQEAGRSEYRSEVNVNFGGTQLQLHVWPGQARIAAASSALPTVVLWGGLLLSLLCASLTHQTQAAQRRARELRALVEQLEQQAAEHRRSEERFRAVVEAAPNALLSVGADGRITLANTQTERLFGYKREELLGQPVEMLVPQRFSDRHVAHRTDFLRTPHARAMDAVPNLCGRCKDGSEVPVEINLNPLVAAEGVAYLVSINDITERQQTEQALRAAKEAAEHAARAKSFFLANMSHEIRTPLNGVIGMTSLLQQTELTLRQAEFTETIRASGEALLGLINDILDFSKIESGRLDLEELPFDPRACVDEVLAMLAHKAWEKGLELACVSDLPPGLMVRGDEARLRQILINLVGNAIKFTPAGEIVVTLEQRPLNSYRLELSCAVRDTGIGIPADKLARLFESFSQVDASTSRQFGGTGLGLAISKRLAEMMGGWVGVESRAGEGSTFFFTITASVEKAQATPEESLALTGKTVLIAVAHSATRQSLIQQAAAWGMKTLSASSAQGSLTLAAAQLPDVTLLDAALPDVERAQLSAALNRLAGAQRRPLILLANGEAGSDAANCDAVLSKPVKQSSLYEALLQAFAPARAAERKAPNQSAAPKLAANLRILLAEDNRINQRVVLYLLELSGCCADVAGNGLEALAALERQPYDLILMDQMMPEMDGLEATRRINAVYGARRPYIIALTANALKGDREICLAAGMDDYLSKPLKLEALQNALGRYTERRQVGAERPQPTPAADAAPPAIDLTRIKDLLEFAGNGTPLLAELIGAYIPLAQERLQEIQTAVQISDPTLLKDRAHALKGSSAEFGAARVVALCTRLETLGRAGQTAGAEPLVGSLATELNEVCRLLQAQA